jgi:hypothetical protein
VTSDASGRYEYPVVNTLHVEQVQIVKKTSESMSMTVMSSDVSDPRGSIRTKIVKGG